METPSFKEQLLAVPFGYVASRLVSRLIDKPSHPVLHEIVEAAVFLAVFAGVLYGWQVWKKTRKEAS